MIGTYKMDTKTTIRKELWFSPHRFQLVQSMFNTVMCVLIRLAVHLNYEDLRYWMVEFPAVIQNLMWLLCRPIWYLVYAVYPYLVSCLVALYYFCSWCLVRYTHPMNRNYVKKENQFISFKCITLYNSCAHFII